MEVGIINSMFKAYTPQENAKRIAAYGIKKVQLDLAFNGKAYSIDELTPEFCSDVRNAFADEGIEIVAISGHQKIAFPETDARQAAKNQFLRKLVLPQRFGCTTIVSETGSANPDNAWVDHPNNYLPEVWDAVVGTMKEICARAKEEGVTFALEPHFGQLTKSPRTLRRMLDDVQTPNLKIALDMANMVIEQNSGDTCALINEFFTLCGNDLSMVHAKDTKIINCKSVFVGAGKGVLDYIYLVKQLKEIRYDGPILLEYVNEEGIQNAYDFLKGLL
ncbi:MAG: sugar phosphate isomerase/epimerase family protein [Clostridia bacterium]